MGKTIWSFILIFNSLDSNRKPFNSFILHSSGPASMPNQAWFVSRIGMENVLVHK